MPFSFGLGKDAALDEERLSTLLGHREIQVIRERPASMQNGAFLKHIRSMSGSMRWDPVVITVLARSLGVHGLLPESEADWLEQAGPAWRE